FADTNKPFLSITNVKSGMLWSNANFTVMGRATDNVAVASVQYSFNSADFTPALTNGSSWSAGVTLLPGTNTFNVYALDTSGNASAVSSVKIVYILSGILTVQTNGLGSISPNDNGVMLQIGKNYTLTATGRDGFTFTNWTGSTNGTFIVLTNKPTLSFTMVSNLVLVANLIDTTKPFISVTNVKTGMLWSNSAFTVQGRATDNVAVASVNYSLNGSPYTTAGLGVGSWSAGVTLVAGTNTFSTYAVDTSGNISATDTVKVVYIVSGILTVQTNGVGSISPNDNGAWLQIGKNYMLTATARDGFTFTNWTGSTNGTFIVLTNKSTTLNFTMVSNLVLVANFVDTTKPFVSITNVTSGKQMTNMAFTVMGVATDNVAVASVNYSLDGDAYTTTPLTGRSWSAGIEMTPGTNKFSVYAVDTAGNVSPTNTIIIVRVPTVTTFLIATNLGITQPFARIAFDGTNYLAVFVGTNGVLGQFVSQTGTLIGGPLSLGPGISEDEPSVEFDGTNYLVVWKELDDQTGGGPAKGVFVSPAGEVSDQITLSQSTSLFNIGTVAFGGGVYFLMWSDISTSPTSVYGAMIDRSGTNVSGDFLISSDASSDETAQNSAAFDGTNFLAVWYPGNASDNLSIQGQLIDTSGNLVGSPFVIYTNSVPTGTAPPQVVFDGSKFLVLFDIGINSAKSSAYHVIGRFVTTSGGVLTNQVNLTSDAGPQIVGSSDFDGFNYLMAWNQGLNLSTVTSSSTINGRFFDPNGMPVSVEFPIFKTSGTRIPTWSPVLFDGTRFVLAAGLAKETSALTFTNGVIYGAFVSP
ncbi:MAG TPA: hypothetical protein VMH87_10190, partial [Pseudomonadales bacterium]|nr:hypothetical protein [Pseudomonadales bacterium]